MDDALQTEIVGLQRMRTDELRQRYREVFGEESNTAHKQHLVKRIAWRLQALAEGDLSERARRRALEIADDADLRKTVPSQFAQHQGQRSWLDSRLPVPGTVLTRVYQDRTIEVKVLVDGFECKGDRYHSLSAVARAVTGTRWNGLVFFGLAKRGAARPRRGKRRAAR
jgi:Protein of unknown function (DUF2924)